MIVRKCSTYNHTVECIVRANELNSARSRVSASASDSTTENKTPAGIECLTVAEEEKLHQGKKKIGVETTRNWVRVCECL